VKIIAPKGATPNVLKARKPAAREKNHSLFLDKDMSPYPDQWAFLSSIKTLCETPQGIPKV
jgi:hypothetical protein